MKEKFNIYLFILFSVVIICSCSDQKSSQTVKFECVIYDSTRINPARYIYARLTAKKPYKAINGDKSFMIGESSTDLNGNITLIGYSARSNKYRLLIAPQRGGGKGFSIDNITRKDLQSGKYSVLYLE